MGCSSTPNLFLRSLTKLMLFLQMPNSLYRSGLHLKSRPEVDLEAGKHAPLATENINNERRACNLPLCPGRGQNLGTPLWEDCQLWVLDSPFKCFIWTAYYFTAKGLSIQPKWSDRHLMSIWVVMPKSFLAFVFWILVRAIVNSVPWIIDCKEGSCRWELKVLMKAFQSRNFHVE